MESAEKKKLFSLSTSNGSSKLLYVNLILLGIPINITPASIFKWVCIITPILVGIYSYTKPYLNDFKTIKEQQAVLIKSDSVKRTDIAQIKDYISKLEFERMRDSANKVDGISETIKSNDYGKVKTKDRVYNIPDNALGEYIEQLLRSGNYKQ